MTMTIAYEQIADLAGADLGYTEYRTVTQDQVDRFADAADDHQWIHVDPLRAKDGPYGATIAHGFLSLSLTIPFWTELLDVRGVATKVNYGLDKVRFPAPVRVGSRVRMRATVAEVVQVPGGYQLAVDQTIDVEGDPKPAVVARGLYRFYA
jgi:acyl dehydratase